MITAQKQRIRYLLTDLLTANLAILLFDIVRFYVLERETVGFHSLPAFLLSRAILVEQILIPLLLIGVSALSGYYNRPLLKSRIQEFVNTLVVALVQTVLVYFALLTNQATSVRLTNYELLLYLFLLLWIVPYMGRYLVTYYAYSRFRKGRWQYNVLVVGLPGKAETNAANINESRAYTGVTAARTLILDPADPSASLSEAELKNLVIRLNLQEVISILPGSTKSRFSGCFTG